MVIGFDRSGSWKGDRDHSIRIVRLIGIVRPEPLVTVGPQSMDVDRSTSLTRRAEVSRPSDLHQSTNSANCVIGWMMSRTMARAESPTMTQLAEHGMAISPSRTRESPRIRTRDDEVPSPENFDTNRCSDLRHFSSMVAQREHNSAEWTKEKGGPWGPPEEASVETAIRTAETNRAELEARAGALTRAGSSGR